ncbi:hypothetical protein GCM10008018_42790 [Paenibacillus marchantiophytorum]|uniref:Uncharacterized protein n=1 Tax=Paenibacillus marchantiophytorum TaxID=1619310 RepID=A0ABQ1EY52_9BACL|nr:hypothetical protein GCM10008018_42790 [Paenibacillus marchantiophytorum]
MIAILEPGIILLGFFIFVTSQFTKLFPYTITLDPCLQNFQEKVRLMIILQGRFSTISTAFL